MFGLFKKKDSCGCGHKHDSLEERKAAAVQQDKEVREALSQKDYDKNVKDTMEGSDPIAKY